jgi:hypothetical protein
VLDVGVEAKNHKIANSGSLILRTDHSTGQRTTAPTN